MPTEYPEILTLPQAAALLQVSERTIQRMVKRGQMPGVQIGGQWRFDRDQLRDLVRGEWTPPAEDLSQVELAEKESMNFGVEIPEAFMDLQQAAAQRLANGENDK